MWFRLLAILWCVSSIAIAQDLPGPGYPALVYADGLFTVPGGSQSTYTLGSTMNVSWQTAYETSNLWLIIGWSFDTPVQLACKSNSTFTSLSLKLIENSAANVGQTWYQWEVTTNSKNSSEVYAFRIVNGTGTDAQQLDGGFLSAAFWIDGLPTTSIPVSSAASRISTSAEAPTTTSGQYPFPLPRHKFY